MKQLKSPSPGLRKQSFYTLYDRIVFLVLFFCVFVLLFSTASSRASTLAEEFSADTSLKVGSLVSLKKDTPKEVELSSVDNSEYLLGVVTGPKENSVTYTKSTSEVTVALSGEVDVYATDANGHISKGDFIGVSWLEGVGMKASIGDKQKLLGVAIEDYDSSSAKQYGDIETPTGKKSVTVQSVKVRLFERDDAGSATSKMSSIEVILSRIAGKNVSVIKITVCLIIFLIGILTAGFFVSSSIKGSFISIGRNPLASSSIYRSLVHVTTMSVGIILIGAALAYVVLAV